MITMYEPEGEPAGTGAGTGASAQPAASVLGAGADAGTTVALHDVELVPGTSRAEFVGTMLDRVPAQARFVEADGDVDVTLRWRTDERTALDLLITSEATAWRKWRDAERRARDFARLHRRAVDVAHTAHSTWCRAVTDLVEQHPSFRSLDDATARADAPEDDQEQARHAAPGDPPIGRAPSRTETAAQAVLRRLWREKEGAEHDAENAETELPRRLVGHDSGLATHHSDPVDPDRDGYEAALEAWHAAADRDGIDVPLHSDEEAVEVTEPGDAAEEAEGPGEARTQPDGGQ